MKSLSSIVLAGLLMTLCLALVSPVQAAEGVAEQQQQRPPRVTVSAQLTTAQGKVYTASIPKHNGYDGVTFPLTVAENQRWIVEVNKDENENTFYIQILDPALPVQRQENGAAYFRSIFAARFDLVSGKPVTVLKTEQYTLDVTLAVE